MDSKRRKRSGVNLGLVLRAAPVEAEGAAWSEAAAGAVSCPFTL